MDGTQNLSYWYVLDDLKESNKKGVFLNIFKMTMINKLTSRVVEGKTDFNQNHYCFEQEALLL